MENAFYQRYEGPISGLRLPRKTWDVLRRHSITTMDEIRAAADRVHRFEGIGPKTARLIREEIARVTAPKGFEAPTQCPERPMSDQVCL